MAASTRTWDHVVLAANAAGINPKPGEVQVLKFSQNLLSDDYKLLELPAEVLESCQNGERLVIRGEAQDDAVLCTDSATFELKLAETSNVLLLAPNICLPKTGEFNASECLIPSEICGCMSSYFELKHRQPKLQKLRILLEESSYRGPIYEKEINKQGLNRYSLEDLYDKVQASVHELQEGLKKLEALEIDGFWRTLEIDYCEGVMVRILSLLDENSWSYDRVPLEETCNVLEELEPRFVIAHCLLCYGEKVSMETERDDNEMYYKLSEDKVCRFYAKYLLRSAGKFNYREFMESWKQSVPEGMHANENHLKGLALTNMNCQPPVIWHFPKENLPSDPGMRFNKLFKMQEKWTFEEVQPYLADLEFPGQSLKALLLKFARCSTNPTGTKVYNSKRPIN